MTEIPASLGLTSQQVAGLLTTAGLAPSLHNSQPWRFRIGPDRIELHADPERALPAADPFGVEQRIGCGAALLNLRLALLGHGIRPDVAIVPDATRPDLLAVIRNGGRRHATPEQERLLRAVPLRRTNRHPFSEVAVTTEEQHALRRAALDEGAWLHVVRDIQQRIRMQELAEQAHQAQKADPAFTAELRRWTAATPDQHDGVPPSAGGPRPALHERWVKRDYTGGSGSASAPGKFFESQPLIAVLTSHLGGPAADVRTGQALQRVLLTATTLGLAASFLSQIIEVPQAREELRQLIGGTRLPLAVLRVGRGWPVPTTPRRSAEELLMTTLAPAR
jgi:nitroreductase